MGTQDTAFTAINQRWRAGTTVLSRAFSFPVMLGVLLCGGGFVAARLRLPDPDTWWHIAVGKHILSTGSWPTSDVYSFTARGTHWIAYEWLGEALMALAGWNGNLSALTALLVLLATIFLVLLYYYGYLRSGNVKASFVTCAALLPVLAVFFTLRPQLMGYIFLLITLICLERYRQGRQKSLWVLPGVFVLWVNTHGTFVFGFAALGLYWAGGFWSFRAGGLIGEKWSAAQRRHLAVVLLLCVLALPLTPYGTRVAAFPLQLALSQPVNIANIQEWQPLHFGLVMGKYILVVLLLFLAAQILFRPSYRIEELALVLLATYAALVHIRFAVLLMVILTPLLASLLSKWLSNYQRQKDRPVLNVALSLLVVLGMVTYLPSENELEATVVKSSYPRAALDYARQEGINLNRTLNEYGWGGYLIWESNGQHQVFIDGRADIYENAGVFGDYLKMMTLHPKTLFLLEMYGIETCLIRRDAPLATLLRALPDWEQVYTDELAVLLVHNRRHSLHPATESAEFSLAAPIALRNP